ncbi:glycosyltransferase family 1 protein [Phanerochaete carnosa HHB-10118-sp]|uniref:Glycosyltransferase family 1 protein n=1 Tax=Phanerochaete carnosa (strain HHB-10118-sp) TaxID=650164 RepID=K5W6H0_PHACS|nr:glycosyltransferase family 1 protein [Phanerochaete carnosa HHB-10118-sp]EKM54549.1 glycosyltransferase family 1 protein [Phanerochaete carnosa HHB-10118-sp]
MATLQHRPHILIAVYMGWGHVRPMCALATRLVKLRSVIITFLTSCQMYDKVTKEILCNFEDGEDALQSRIRVAGLVAHEHDMFEQEIIGKSFEQRLQRILAAESAFCSTKQRDIPALSPPHALIIDMFAYHFFQIARKQSGTVKILVSLPPPILCMSFLSGPFGSDTHGELDRRVQAHMRKTGQIFIEAAGAVTFPLNNEVVQIPGLPPMYDYEKSPQEPVIKVATIGHLHVTAASLVHECDGVISCSMACIEPQEILLAFFDFLALNSRKMYVLGILLPERKRLDELEKTQAAKSAEITNFMQNVLETLGERSMIYISFGTVVWTTQPEKVWTFLDVLMDQKIPFIMAQASPFCHLTAEVAQRVKASGTGLITSWAPQQAILEHPVTGWFVTHGGFNSITESIHAGIPMICWPFGGDQPLNAIHLTENLDVAYELFEVRTGESGLKPIYRTGKAPTGTLEAVREEAITVLGKAFGEDGVKKRANIQRLREASLKLWKEGGEAHVAAEQLLDWISA